MRDLKMFLAAARLGSFRAAADELGATARPSARPSLDSRPGLTHSCFTAIPARSH